jgi:type IV pilus assembly protein PilV
MSRRPTQRARARSRRRAGYTLVEVMLAVAVLAVGATAILGLQEAAIRGNQEANEHAIATRVAEMWLDRFRIDALSWTQGGAGVLPSPATFAQTQFMRGMPAAGSTGFFFPAPATPGGFTPAAGLSFQGNPTAAPGAPTPIYCTQANLSWVFPGTAIRADVRVYWPRRSWANGATTLECPADPPLEQYHMVSAATVLRWTPAAPRRN